MIYTLSLPDIYLLVPCPRCPMSSYINGGWEALEGHGNDANHDHSQIWQYAPHFSETVTQIQINRDSQDIIYLTSEWFYYLSIYWTSLHIVSLNCFAIGAGGDILMIPHRIAFGEKWCQLDLRYNYVKLKDRGCRRSSIGCSWLGSSEIGESKYLYFYF